MYKHLQHIHVSSERNNKNPLFSHASSLDYLFFPLLFSVVVVPRKQYAIQCYFNIILDRLLTQDYLFFPLLFSVVVVLGNNMLFSAILS